MVLKQDATKCSRSRLDVWDIHLDRSFFNTVQPGLDREWLVTNGLGGYASGSLMGATTRCYHGLLVASLKPPVERKVLVAKIDEEVQMPDGSVCFLGVNEYQGGIIDPQGYHYLDSFSLKGDIPCFFYRLGMRYLLEKRIWMEYGQNTTYVQYLLHTDATYSTGLHDAQQRDEAETSPVTLLLSPYCLSRDYHDTTQGSLDWHFSVEHGGNRCRIRAHEDAPAYHLIADPLTWFKPTGIWYWHVWHRRDDERGLLAREDVYQPGVFCFSLAPGEYKTLVLTAETDTACSWGYGGEHHEEIITQAWMRHQHRMRHILTVADRSTNDLPLSDPILARLVLAADQFIVARPDHSNPAMTYPPLHLSPDRKTIIAGYPWFTDWGRDTMISLPGLLLYTGRYSEARGLLKAFTACLYNGLLPNRFPDDGQAPTYNTVDAALWMFRALDHYVLKTGDFSLIKELFPKLSEIVSCYIHGTDFGISVDPVDGLLRSGGPGLQLTWMDVKIDEWVVTPRWGKAVEVNVLWYYTLTVMESWAVRLSTDAGLYGYLRNQVRQNFASRFWYEKGGYLYDVVDVQDKAGCNDTSLRPNQLFAASLTSDLLSEKQVVSLLYCVTEHLLTPVGLRSLSQNDPAYHTCFAGNYYQRDSAYHQGAAWPWLMGAYIDTCLRVNNNPAAVASLLEPFVERLYTTCLGTIGELTEPEAPFSDGGCVAQAWSVAEILRCWSVIRNNLR